MRKVKIKIGDYVKDMNNSSSGKVTYLFNENIN